MTSAETTCWTMIDAAVKGVADQREEFARRYAGPVEAYLAARWHDSPYSRHLDDALQEVFLQCFKTGGPLERVDRSRPGGFRPYFYGLIQNVARSFERRNYVDQRDAAGTGLELAEVASDETSLSAVYDRAWAKSIVQEAARRQLEQAQQAGAEAVQRVELLRLRFHEELSIREIAHHWEVDAAKLHREYAKARKEFKAALLEVVSFNNPGSPAEVARECAELLAVLQ